jgi:methyltransferase (TIGR00027 family)
VTNKRTNVRFIVAVNAATLTEMTTVPEDGAASASRTAEYMALFRALETRRRGRLFDDPFARAFLSPRLRAVVRAAAVPLLGAAVAAYVDRRWPGARTSGVARTRLIDDAVAAAVGQGVHRVVLLGAGFDARAYRMPALASARVFEVDRLATQTVKRERLRAVLGAIPAHVRFVAVDFYHDRLDQALAAAGFDARRPAIFVWEGVTNYLTATAVDTTLRVVAASAAGTRLVVTYVDRRVLDGTQDTFIGTVQLRALLRRSGEPWTFGLDPATVREYLAERGLALEEDVGATEYRARYFGTAARRMRGYEFYRVATAVVAG